MPRKIPKQPQSVSLNTRIIHGLFFNDPITSNIHAPLNFGTTFLRNEQYEKPDERGYIRDDNPSADQVSAMINALENGFETLMYPSGAAAMNAVFHNLSQGECALVQDSLYFGLPKLLDNHVVRHGVKIVYFPAGDEQAMADAITRHKPKILWIETPSNPMIVITDIAKAAKLIHAIGGKLIVDSTCASPIITKPLDIGADIVMHSATKYLNGHTDVLAGCLTTKEDDEFWQKIRECRFLAGWVLGTMDMFLLARGLKTLFYRMKAHCENAMIIANFLNKHSKIERVLYPGLPSHVGHKIAQSQMIGGFGGLMSVQVKGDEQDALNAIKKFQIIRRATSLGGIESKAEHRFTIEGEYSKSPPNLIRFSTGLESPDDLMNDWNQALS